MDQYKDNREFNNDAFDLDCVIAARHVACETCFRVQAEYSGRTVPDKAIADYEAEAFRRIAGANTSEFDKAYEELVVDQGVDADGVSAFMILRHIGEKAVSMYDTIAIRSINVVRELTRQESAARDRMFGRVKMCGGFNFRKEGGN